MSKIEDSLAQEILNRAETGLKKYGVTVERTDLSYDQWLQHLKEELMDSLVYIERIKSFKGDDSEITKFLFDVKSFFNHFFKESPQWRTSENIKFFENVFVPAQQLTIRLNKILEKSNDPDCDS
jgi:hypothetical protein